MPEKVVSPSLQAPLLLSGVPDIETTSGKKVGYIQDFISGKPVRASKEEIEAVQVFARRLVDDYDYDKEQIQTRPQYGVRRNPSGTGKSYPVDIAVFKDNKRTEENIYMIIECKKKSRKDGLAQLKIYLDLSRAEIGVWFNGEDHIYLRKNFHSNGTVTYDELPNIPRKGQRVEDIGLYKRSDLRPPSNLKSVFRDIRNHLAGNMTGITRDSELARQIINVLFCKIYDEINTNLDQMVTFRTGFNESPHEVKKRIIDLFENEVKPEYPDVFTKEDSIILDEGSLMYIIGELQNYCIIAADRDAIGDAFEVFIGPGLRGDEGQFFTPRNVVQMVIEILDPKPGESIIDPACGSGGFLISALSHVWRKLDNDKELKGWSEKTLTKKKDEAASRYFRGIDKDAFLAKVTKAYMAIMGDGRGGVFCENGLAPRHDWSTAAQEKIQLGSFDIVVANPPYGKKIKIKGTSILSQYPLAYKWAKNKASGKFDQTNKLLDDSPPQLLFLDRCLQLLKPNGRMGIVLPEAIFGLQSYEHVIQYLNSKTKILGIVSMPEDLFKTSGKSGTHTKVCVLFLQNTAPHPADDYKIFMAEAKWCGHNSRGNPTIRIDEDGNAVLLDDIPLIAAKYKEIVAENG